MHGPKSDRTAVDYTQGLVAKISELTGDSILVLGFDSRV